MSNPSVPPRHSAPPRPLGDEERRTLLAVAEVLIPDVPGRPAASAAPDYSFWLDRALAARSDAFEEIMELIGRLRDVEPVGLPAELRTISETQPAGFQALSSVLAGAYLMVPAIRRAINYPGKQARPAAFDEAAEEIMSGILDPVIERGPM